MPGELISEIALGKSIYLYSAKIRRCPAATLAAATGSLAARTSL
jgi:hypothetical protein